MDLNSEVGGQGELNTPLTDEGWSFGVASCPKGAVFWGVPLLPTGAHLQLMPDTPPSCLALGTPDSQQQEGSHHLSPPCTWGWRGWPALGSSHPLGTLVGVPSPLHGVLRLNLFPPSLSPQLKRQSSTGPKVSGPPTCLPTWGGAGARGLRSWAGWMWQDQRKGWGVVRGPQAQPQLWRHHLGSVGGDTYRDGDALDRSGGQLTAKPPMAGVASILPARLGLGC